MVVFTAQEVAEIYFTALRQIATLLYVSSIFHLSKSGRYGSTTRLISKQCTAPCPMGRYNDQLGAKSVRDCRPCPKGKFGSTQALTTASCSGGCPTGKYSNLKGIIQAAQCKDCYVGYRGWQCDSWNNAPLSEELQNKLNGGNEQRTPDRILE